MASESIAHSAAIDSEPIWARGIIIVKYVDRASVEYRLHIGRVLVEYWLSIDWRIDWSSVNCQSTFGRNSICSVSVMQYQDVLVVYWSRVVSAERDLVSWLNYVVPNANYSFGRFNGTKMDKATNFFPLHVLPATGRHTFYWENFSSVLNKTNIISGFWETAHLPLP